MFESKAAKRLLSIYLLITISVLTVLSGCRNNIVIEETPDTPEPDVLHITATAFATYDFCRQIAGELAEVEILIGPGEDSHSYTPTKKDMDKITSADIFIFTVTENRIKDATQTDDNPNRRLIDVSSLVPMLETTAPAEMDTAFETDDTAIHHEKYDEHVWTSIDNAEVICQAIADTLCEIDEENSYYYRSNCEVYLSQLSSLKRDIRRIVSSAERKTIIMAGRNSLRYFAEEFGLEVYTAYPDCTKPYGDYPGAVKFLEDKALVDNIPVVFYDEMTTGSIAQKITDGTGKETAVFYSCHNISMEDYISGATYLELMTRNERSLETALN